MYFRAALLLALLTKRDGQNYIWIAPGAFEMGCSERDAECFQWELPAHQVKITEGFWIGQTEVTQQAYQRVTGTNPSLYRGPQRPVDRVSWFNAQAYCKKIGMRLPTGAEWEYAARAGVSASRSRAVDSLAWFDADSDDRTHDVAKKPLGPAGNSPPQHGVSLRRVTIDRVIDRPLPR